MKTVQALAITIIVCLGINIYGQNKIDPVNTMFHLVVDSEKIHAVVLSKYNFETSKMNELKSLSELSIKEAYQFVEPFSEPAIYSITLNTGNELRIAVEQAGEVRLKLGEQITLESEVAVKSNFATSIQQLNIQFFSDLIADFDKAVKENDQATISKLEQRKEQLMPDFSRAMQNLVRDMGTSAQAYDALQYFDVHKNYPFLLEMSAAFNTHYPQYKISKSLKSKIAKASQLALGRPAPLFSVQELGGAEISLASYQGSYILIDFWASWCRACRVENPKFVGIYKQYHDRGFDILSISQDSDVAHWKEAIEQDRLPWPNVLDNDRALWNLYILSSLPSNFLLDPTGKIIAKNINADQLTTKLRHLISK